MKGKSFGTVLLLVGVFFLVITVMELVVDCDAACRLTQSIKNYKEKL